MNLITAACVKRLGIRTSPCNRLIRGIGNFSGTALTAKATITILSRYNKHFTLTAEFTIMDSLVGQLPSDILGYIKLPPEIQLADPNYAIPSDVELLFGAGIWAKIICAGVYRNKLGTLLQQSELGYLILWSASQETLSLSQVSAAESMHDDQCSPNLSEELKRFWETQELSSQRIRSPQAG